MSGLPDSPSTQTSPQDRDPSRATRLADHLGLPDLRPHLPLTVALAIDAIGSGTSGPLLLLYLTRVIGLQLPAAGLLLTVTAVTSLLVPALVGVLTRRVGARTIVIGAQLIQAAAMLGLLTARGLPLIAAAAAAAAIGQRAFWSSVFALVAAAADDAPDARSDRWYAAAGMIQNAGFALGGLLAGGLLLLPGAIPFQVALAVNGGSFLLSALLFRTDRHRRRTLIDTAPAPTPSRRRPPVWKDLRYLTLIAGNTLFALCSVLLGIGLPVYALDFLDAPRWLIGPLLAVVTVLGATCQGVGVRATRSWPRVGVLTLAGAVWVVWGLMTAALSLLGAGLLIGGLLLCVLLFAVAELLHAPASMGLAAARAPAADRESYLSWFQYSFAIASIAAPSVFAALTERSAMLPWLAASAAAAAAVVLTRLATRRDGS